MSEPRDRDDQSDDDDVTGAAGDRLLHPAVYASNWRTVLLVDAAMGVAVAVAGLVVAVVWNIIAGSVLGACGIAYVVAVARRGRQWAALRCAVGR